MTIKEFSHEHALIFFWSTVVLAILVIYLGFARIHRGPEYMMKGGHEISDRMMNRQYDKNQSDQRQMMNPNNPNQPLTNDTPDAAETVKAGTPVNPNVPVQVQ